MKNSHEPSIPDEHLDHVHPFSLGIHPPTRLKGNLKAATSPDPYHQIFRGLGYPPVVSYAEARTVADRNGLRLPAAYARPSDVTPVDLLHSRSRAAVLNLIAVLTSYGVVTNNQAAVFTGEVAYADPHSPLVADLFRSGLIALSPAHQGFGLASVGNGAAVYKLASWKKVRDLRDYLTHAEWLAVTGNRPLPTGRVNVRHDVLGAELALRSAQLPQVGTVLGPHFSTFADLAPAGLYGRETKGGPDLVIVREDGLRIAVEITATIGRGFHEKVKRWAKTLAANPFDQSGLMVVFLAAPTAEDQHGTAGWTRRMIHEAVAAAFKSHVGSVRDRTADRMGVATWREWFPDSLVATERFANLTVDRPTGRAPLWETCDLLAPATLPIHPPARPARRSVITFASVLAQTPPEVRLPHRPANLNADLLRTAAGPVPSVAPLRDRSGTRSPGAGQGAAGDALIPERLLGTTRGSRSPRERINWTPPPRQVKRRLKTSGEVTAL